TLANYSAIHDLGINNTDGVLSALNGSINLDLGDAPKGTTLSVIGGDLLSQSGNADACPGNFTPSRNNMPGRLNVKAGGAFVGTSSSSLNLGNMNITGDPTFWSTESITLSDDQLFNEAFTLLSGKNIDLQNVTIGKLSGTLGFDITIVAGANLVPPTG